jgi:hypothetical protein
MKKNIYTENTYRLKLLLNIVTAGTEALLSWNKFLYEYACIKEVPPVNSAAGNIITHSVEARTNTR